MTIDCDVYIKNDLHGQNIDDHIITFFMYFAPNFFII